jgi:hypothetical protein
MYCIPGGLVGLEVEGLEQLDNGDLDLHHGKSLSNTGPTVEKTLQLLARHYYNILSLESANNLRFKMRYTNSCSLSFIW